LHNDDGILTNYISITHDISEKKQKDDLIHNLAYYDSLTKLPNKVLFEERLSSRMPATKRSQKKMALLFINMDNFKNINDTLGHLMGDKFLIEVASLIKRLIREEDTFARLGGDEFTILLEEIKEENLAVIFHKNLSNRAYEEIYNNSTEDFQSSGEKEEFIKFLKTIRTTLGEVKTADVKDWSINNTSKARLINLTYETHYEKGIAAESFVFSTQNKVTKLHRYSIKSDYLLNNK